MERRALEELLDRVSEGDEEARQTLLAHIAEQPEGIRVLAYEALKDGGEETYDQLLLTLADDPDLVIRPSHRNQPITQDADMEGMHLIAQQAGREWQARAGTQQAPAALIEQLRSGERTARAQAARTLGEHRDPAAVEPLIQAIRSGDRQLAGAAVEALQAIGEPAGPALAQALSDPDEQVRWHAAKALSTIGASSAAPALVVTLEDSNYGTRWLAAEGLARLGRPAIVPLLRRLADEKGSAWLRQGAWHVFNKLELMDDNARREWKTFGAELRRSSGSAVPNMARQALRRLGEEA